MKDNPNRYWFKRKVWGWGWTPATWEGWVTLVAVIALIIWNGMHIDSTSHSVSDTVRPFVIQTAVLVTILIAICYWKGEKPKWQWGFPKKEDKSSELAQVEENGRVGE